ncbi:MAG: oxygen-independent coproporphyrinogen-3 oxidase [Lentimonas sp.]|jgi:oxygen-independent coproporphyrinogen-3 oxidase
MHLQDKELKMIDHPAKTALGLYCHVPFCASTCDFCAFYQEKPRRGDLDRYLSAMDAEFALISDDRAVDTVFWGGGTPGLLSAKDLERLGRSMLECLGNAPAEWTIEMAPSTVKADKLAVLRDLGVTRISMGVQSFDEKLLESLGRLHRPNQIYKAWELVQAAGFPQTNLDLMFAIPNQSMEQWEAAIREAARLGPTHLSTYCLTFEEDTALYVKLSEGKLKIDEERELLFYERGWELLAELGYAQYEISNFSRGGECIHNVNTWRMTEWIGCGPSAASQYRGERYQRPSNLKEWATAMESRQPPKAEMVSLDDSILMTDAIIFGLRMNAGIDLADIALRFPAPKVMAMLEPLLARFEAEGLLILDGAHARLTHKGRLVCDAIGSAVLEAVV